jgi:hypothetical protein
MVCCLKAMVPSVQQLHGYSLVVQFFFLFEPDLQKACITRRSFYILHHVVIVGPITLEGIGCMLCYVCHGHCSWLVDYPY